MFKQFCAALMVLMIGLLAFTPAASQDGRGVIIEPNPSGATSIGPINPLLCTQSSCQTVVDFLFPTLFAADPASGLLVGANPGNHGLVDDPALQSGDVQTFKLRDDLTWSDGAPITAYDVFYSYLVLVSDLIQSPYPALRQQIVGAKVIDDHTIAFQYAAPDCSTLPRANFAVAPSHVFDPDFKTFVDTTNQQQSDLQPADSWLKAYPEDRFSIISSENFNQTPTATAGIFNFDAVRPGEDVRLSADNTSFVYADLSNGLSPADDFLAGKASVLINPPLERRDDFRATPGLQITDAPSPQWDAIVFNTADPNKPQNAFDDQGKPLDQGHHPLFGDVRVRRAVQMAIDSHELAEVVYHGNSTPIASSLPPTSWGFNPDLKPLTYDPIGAERLLESAGWKDTNGDGVRECHGCLYAEEGTSLSFNLGAEPLEDLYEVAGLITEQLARVGFSVNNLGGDDPSSQVFDAHLTTSYSRDNDPDQSQLFTAEGDVLNTFDNIGSYTNPQIEMLMQQARTVPGCDQATRAKIYQQIQSILHDDQPYAFLYARNDMIVAQGGVLGFDPLPDNPFWNIRDWVVTK